MVSATAAPYLQRDYRQPQGVDAGRGDEARAVDDRRALGRLQVLAERGDLSVLDEDAAALEDARLGRPDAREVAAGYDRLAERAAQRMK